jgi:hypothetical protein
VAAALQAPGRLSPVLTPAFLTPARKVLRYADHIDNSAALLRN